MTQPKVLILSGTFREKADGVARTLFRLSATLAKERIEHHVFAPMVDPAPPENLPYLTVHRVRSAPIPLYPEYRISLPGPYLEKQWDAIAPNIVHIATPDLLGWWGLRYALKRRLPVIAAYHTNFPSYLQYYRLGILEPLCWRYLRWFYDRCALLLSPTEEMSRELRAHAIGSGDKLRLWGRGIEAPLFNASRRSRELRRVWGGDEQFYVAFLGRLVWYKEVGIVREVFKRLQSYDKRLRFVFIGDGPARRELEQTMPGAIFLGHVEKQRVGEALASCDALLFPSKTETYGQAVMESMACGVPPIVSDRGGPCEIVRDAQAGIVVPAGDVAGFTQAVQKLFAEKKLHLQARQQGLAFTANRDWHQVNEIVVRAYRELAKP